MDIEKVNKPGDSNLKQQRLKSWNFSISKRALALTYLISGLFWILIGTIIIIESNSVIKHSIRYDNKSDCKTNWHSPKSCIFQFELHEKMKNPIFIYYELSNYYQNHRKYLKSRDIFQLMGKHVTKNEADSRCIPAVTMEQMEIFTYNSNLSPKSLASPCGLMAKSFFNDSYRIFPKDPKKSEIEISTHDISWGFETDRKFKNHEKAKMWTDVEKSHFINWMSPAGLPTFQKLWGKITHDLEKGTYYLIIKSNYDVSKYDGEKAVIITTHSLFGGKMVFLGVFSLIIGTLSVLFSAGMLIMLVKGKRKRIDFK